MKPVRDYLLDLMEYIGYLQAFTAEGRDVLDSDVKTRLAVINSYMIIGEIVKRLPDDLLSQQPQIRWKNIKGFRDILIHKYDDIDLDQVWKAVEDLPNMRTAVEALLAATPTDDET
jgi:uncharacterized protein with HEPN domain